jgi:hypothetical protein
MSKHIRVENDQVVECLDYLPENYVGDWRVAIEIEPVLVVGRQIIGSHSFDLTKNPAEILWSDIDLSVEDRKDQILGSLNQESYHIVHAELIKEFQGNNSDFVFVQSAISVYRQKRAEILALSSHNQIDLFIADNT